MDQFIYQKLVESEPLGFIDPFEDLGTFDSVLMKFVEPVERLVNKYSGNPYNPYWQERIKEMRKLYIEYLECSQSHNELLDYRLRNDEAKKHADEIVT
ncbi:MAG: modification methylase Sau96I, partial [Streptococcus sp.]|nr:modification methylase Sau96I [Streptococcus sp.]